MYTLWTRLNQHSLPSFCVLRPNILHTKLIQYVFSSMCTGVLLISYLCILIPFPRFISPRLSSTSVGYEGRIYLSLMTPQEVYSFLTSSRCSRKNEMPFKMVEFDWFPGHGLENGGARKQRSINLSFEKHPWYSSKPPEAFTLQADILVSLGVKDKVILCHF